MSPAETGTTHSAGPRHTIFWRFFGVGGEAPRPSVIVTPAQQRQTKTIRGVGGVKAERAMADRRVLLSTCPTARSASRMSMSGRPAPPTQGGSQARRTDHLDARP